MIPVLIGVLVSYAVANALSMPIFEVILEMKNLPFLPTLTSIATYNMTAGDLMNTNYLYLIEKARLADIPLILNKVGNAPVTIPVVDTIHKK
jgi:hypothetical protein